MSLAHARSSKVELGILSILQQAYHGTICIDQADQADQAFHTLRIIKGDAHVHAECY